MNPALVPEVLAEYGAATRAVLFEYIPRREPSRHLYDLVADYPRRGGRAFRPSLCIATARAFGRPTEDALRTAASIELLHNAMLIHDDIEDESEERRGGATLHRVADVPRAINAGDMLTTLALTPLFENARVLGPWLAFRLLEETHRMVRESIEGQAIELGWRHDNATDVSERDYLGMVLKKTCWLSTIHPCRAGALVGTNGMIELEPFVRFGFLLGAAFQIQDDLLNLEGDAARYGKELAGDIYEGKRTLMLIRLFERADEGSRARLKAILARPRGERTVQDIRWVRAAMDHHDCIGYARKVAHGLAGAARREFRTVFGALPDTRDRRFIEALPAWVIERA